MIHHYKLVDLRCTLLLFIRTTYLHVVPISYFLTIPESALMIGVILRSTKVEGQVNKEIHALVCPKSTVSPMRTKNCALRPGGMPCQSCADTMKSGRHILSLLLFVLFSWGYFCCMWPSPSFSFTTLTDQHRTILQQLLVEIDLKMECLPW